MGRIGTVRAWTVGVDDIERWFVARGLPHFVERRDSAWEIWGRAAPLLAVAYLLLGLYALDLSEWSLTENLVAGAAVVGAAVLTWVIANAVRGRPWFDRPHEVGPVELAAFIVVPAIASLVVGQPLDAIKTVVIAVVILAVLWAVTSYGVPALLGWAWQRTWSQLSTLLNVLARALPMLLLFSAFLFINAEAWQVAGTLTGHRLRRRARDLLPARGDVRDDPHPGADALAQPVRLVARGRRAGRADAGRRPCSTPSPSRSTRIPTPNGRRSASGSTSAC